jgi:hypothetical protein
MLRAAICFSAALVLGFPNFSHAQYNDNDRQNSGEYTDEDSQPLALMADVLYPVGFAAEWLIARPLHYVATDSPIAPVFRPVGGTDNSPPPPVPIIPDNSLALSGPASGAPQDWSPTKAATVTSQAAPSATIPIVRAPAVPPVSAYSSPPPRQSQMH